MNTRTGHRVGDGAVRIPTRDRVVLVPHGGHA